MSQKFRSLFLAAVAICACRVFTVGQTQTLPFGLENIDGSSSTNSPFTGATVTNVIWQWCYDSSLFVHRGPMSISDLRIRGNVGLAVAAFNFPSLEIVMSTSPTGVGALSTTFATNLGGDAMVVRTAGPFVGPGTLANVLGPCPFISVGLTSSFNYDPCLGDLIIQVRKCGTTVQWSNNLDAVTLSPTTLHRIGHTTNCLNLTSNSTGAGFAPVLEIAFTPLGPASEPFERNDLFASITLDGRTGNGFAPVSATKCVGDYTRVCINHETLAGPFWDLALTTAPPIAAPTCISAGTGILTLGGQKINLNLSAPDLGFVNGLTFQDPWTSKIFIPFQAFAPLAYTAQFFVLDGAHPDGVVISAPAHVVYIGATPLPAPIAGPATDDSAITVAVGCVPFYGTAYTQIHPISNGRVMFVGQDVNAAPDSASEILFDNPFFGFWMDLDPGSPGSGLITVSSPTPDTFRVDYAGIPYFAESNLIVSTFSAEINSATGEVLIDGILGIQPHPALVPTSGDNALVGISAGVGQVIDAGPTAFTLGGPNLPGGPLTAIYNLGLSNPTLAGLGTNSLRFTPILSGLNQGNYTWTAF